jgi:hypothetical protein
MVNVQNLHLQYITDKKGQKKFVILYVSDFMEMIEDIEDLAAVAERKEEPTVPHEELSKELEQNGLI